jgi:hypothetical protein
MDLAAKLQSFIETFLKTFDVNHLEDGNCNYDQNDIE